MVGCVFRLVIRPRRELDKELLSMEYVVTNDRVWVGSLLTSAGGFMFSSELSCDGQSYVNDISYALTLRSVSVVVEHARSSCCGNARQCSDCPIPSPYSCSRTWVLWDNNLNVLIYMNITMDSIRRRGSPPTNALNRARVAGLEILFL